MKIEIRRLWNNYTLSYFCVNTYSTKVPTAPSGAKETISSPIGVCIGLRWWERKGYEEEGAKYLAIPIWRPSTAKVISKQISLLNAKLFMNAGI